MRLTLLCHAATSAVRASAFPSDEPLEERALQKLAALSHRLGDADRVLTSPALRARQTADALALAASVEPALRDCDYGRWTGLSLEDVNAGDPEALGNWLQDPAAAPHGGESVEALIERVGGWLAQGLTESGTILAITHAAIMRAAIVTAVEASARSFAHIDIAPLTLVRLSGHGGRWTLTYIGPLAGEA